MKRASWLRARRSKQHLARTGQSTRGSHMLVEQLEARMLLDGPNDGGFGLPDDVHQHLVIRLGDQQVDIPSDIGVTNAGEAANPHTHNADGLLHEHSLDGNPPAENITLGDFFDVWRRTPGQLAGNNPNAVLTSTQLMDRLIDDNHQIRMFVNGVERDEYDNYVLQDGDQIVLSYERSSAYPAPVLNPINDVTMPAGQTFAVPLNGSARGHGPLTFTAVSSDPQIVVETLSGGPSVTMSITATSGRATRMQDFSLEDLNPNSASFGQLVGPSFYYGQNFVSVYYFTNPG